jgi:hypothetical protein
MIKLNGKKYFCCSEIIDTALGEISKVFDQYTNRSTPYPPVNGILQITDEHREHICLIQTNLKNKIEKYYCDSNETCCRPETILNYLNELKHCNSDVVDYDQYINSIETLSDCNEIKSEFCNFLENTCVGIIVDCLNKM